MEYQATLDSPLGKLGILTTKDKLIGIHFLPSNTPMIKPKTYVAKETVLQLQCYFADPFYPFNLPVELKGTVSQKKLWESLLNIPVGQTNSYGEQAELLKSGAQAIGNACRANPIPIVFPCHRIVAKDGLGGYAGETEGHKLERKKWLLAHEANAAQIKKHNKSRQQKQREPLFV